MLNNLSIKSKLLLSMILPVVGMMYFASLNIIDRYQKIGALEKINNIVVLNVSVASLVHELQKERGYSSGFLSSYGKKFIKRLEEQTKATDKKILRFKKSLNICNSNNSLSIFKNNISQRIKKLSIIRSQVSSLLLEPEKAVELYTQINSSLLDFIYSTFKKTNNKEMSGALLSYSNFLFATERVGLERALVTKMLIKDKDYKTNRLKLSNLITLEENFLNHFFKLSKNSNLKKLYKSIYDDAIDNKIKKIEKNILSSSTNSGVDAQYWFNLITQKIDKQNIIAKELSKNLLSLSKKQMSKAKDDMFVYNLISTFILFIVILLFVLIAKNINLSVKKILKGVSSISKNKITKYKNINIESKDEFSTIADTLNIMAQTLIRRYVENEKNNKKLIEAEKKATLSAKVKSEFLANMSHEIRTPLNAILGFIDLLKDEIKGRKAKEYVNIIDSSSKGLLKVIEDILDFSKIESGKLDIDKIDFNSKAEFEVIIYLFMARCSQKNITLSLVITQDIPQIINTDPLRIKQIISNLISNSIKFTDVGKNITVEIGYKDKFLSISVKDEGKGISKDKQRYIFEAFRQEDNSTTREYGGTGLGLSISAELVKLLGGELKLKSELGVGSEFYFSIPVEIGKEQKYTLKALNELNLEGKKILLVEDNKENQMFMQIIFKKLKLKFDIADDGVEAIERYKTNTYDAILMDENMPNMNGIEATRHILKYEKENNLPHTSIIALTANAIKGDRKRFLDAGMDEYLTKPIKKETLQDVFRRFL